MKKIAACSLAAVAALLSFTSPAMAGILMLDNGSPTYTPTGGFTDNTIVADTIVVGGLIHLQGSVTVTPDASDVAMIEVKGTYSGAPGELFSIAYNSAADQTILTDVMLAPTEDAESALVAHLDPGAYTAVVRGVDDTTGVALVEAYDLDNGATDSKLGNIGTRGLVGTGEDVMIGGFILGGGGGFAQVIVRGIRPSLADFGLTNVLADPTLDLFDEDGNLIASNDNWMDDPNMQTVADRGLAPSDPNDRPFTKCCLTAPIPRS